MGKWMAAGLCLLLACMSGCENKQVTSMQGAKNSLVDPALDSFENEHILGLGYAATGERANWAEVKKLGSADSFKAGVTTLESAPLPSGGDAAKKAAIVAAAKKLSEAGTNEEIEAAYKEMMAAKTAYRN
ncbi:MAG: hypothetical protein SH850_27300 [Planctomycetaceae bacterium]|nr:hypothetical protein [Planctomycetaceae bacterium]